jgi:hypothetical protein
MRWGLQMWAVFLEITVGGRDYLKLYNYNVLFLRDTFSRFTFVICEIELEKYISLGNEVEYRDQVKLVNITYV